MSSVQQNCFFPVGNTTQIPNNFRPCRTASSLTDYVNCCAAGDYCLSDNVCRFTHNENNGHQKTGYYISGCTDSSLKDEVCSQHCTKSLGVRDISYSPASNLWSCCAPPNNDPGLNWTCTNPSHDETWQGTPQASLSTLAVLPTSTGIGSQIASTYTPTSALITSSASLSTGTASAAPTNTRSSSEVRGWSRGEKAGIGVAISFGVLAFLALTTGLFLFLRRRQRAAANGSPGRKSGERKHKSKAYDGLTEEYQKPELWGSTVSQPHENRKRGDVGKMASIR